MASQQVLSALEIADNRAILVTGEFLNSRLNILRVDQGEIEGVKNGFVTKQQAACISLQRIINNSSNHLGIAINKVILMIPDFAVKKVSKRVTVQIKNSDRRIRAKDINLAIKEAIRSVNESNLELVNVVTHRFFVNEVPFYQTPLNEIADIMAVDVDLLFADRKVTHQYVAICEKIGLKIIDICLSCYASGKEMALFQQPEELRIITINLQKKYTSFSLFAANRLTSVKTIGSGYGLWLDDIVESTGISEDIALKLCKESLSIEDFDDQSTVWYQQDNEKPISISQGLLNNIAINGLEKWIKDVVSLCRPIADKGQVVYYLYGEACDIKGITTLLKQELQATVNLYIPKTIGARKSVMTAVLGAFYVYNDLRYMHDSIVSSVDLDAFNRIVSESYVRPDRKITQRIKTLFFEK